MKVLVAGASGTIGGALCNKLLHEGMAVAALTRSRESSAKILHARTRIVEWNPAEREPPEESGWTERCGDIDAVVNLVGEPIAGGRWSEVRKRRILDSRVGSTRAIVHAASAGKIRPKIFINASAVGYYGFHHEKIFTEDDGPGTGFLSDVCVQWEKEIRQLHSSDIRTVILRIGMVLSASGGALQQMLPVFRYGLGGTIGSGDQMMSWIHIDDLLRVIIFALGNPIEGAFNAVSPNPVTNREFTAALGTVLGKPAVFTVPGFLLRLRYGEMSDLLIKSQHVLPKRLSGTGFEFTFSDINAALEHLLKK
ncbi:TIGR01777 family oxidoreductase [candidate division KSB1 bacterium]